MVEPIKGRPGTPQRSIRRAFQQAAAGYDEVAVLPREVGDRLLERLDLIRIAPRVVCDLGAGTGVATRELKTRYKSALVVAVDSAPAMLKLARKRAPWLRRWRSVCADAEQLPFADGSCDLVFSNLVLEWVTDLDRCVGELRRVLSPGGCLLFSTLGPDTLRELRQAWAQVDQHCHVNDFLDMHDIGDALMRARLADPVMDVERFTLTYRALADLMCELNAQGSSVARGRAPGLTGSGRLAAATRAYETSRREGRLPATFEVVYGHAWGVGPPDPRLAQPAGRQYAAIGVERLRDNLRGRRSS